jgi:polar amino acid transport system permease protein
MTGPPAWVEPPLEPDSRDEPQLRIGGPPARSSKLFGRRAFLVSTASTIVFFAAVTLIVVLSPGFEAVRQGFFNLHAMRASFFGVPSEGLPPIWRGFLLNVEVFLIAEVLILILALLIAVIRQIPGPVFFPFRLVAIVYTDLFRGTPLLLVILMFGFGIPALAIRGLPRSYVFWGSAALVLSYSAYVAEVFRAGIESVHASQTAAARALGLSRWQALRFVVIPQAVRRVIPPLLNDFVSLQKDTALLATLGAIEAVRAAEIYTNYRFNYSPYVITALLFILLTIPLARFTDHLIERDRRRRSAGMNR